ncbi:MAG TPA: pyridoxamine 5'-phosphate oxidase family protein [Candidatus Acidoferrum sp.]|jgi:PPOX class probable F420-dependent enzyme|nr:pyridoxamine 5'-phosphate oxidase family protein [Candidatus Acidoferrum sp.]
MSLDQPIVQRFLDTKHVIVLATVQPDGAPLATAMWFLHDSATLTMISVDNLQKIHNLRRDPRVSVVAEASDVKGGGGRGVALQGRVEFLADGPERRALVDRFHTKYPELQHHWKGRPMPPDRVMFKIVPGRVRTWGLD